MGVKDFYRVLGVETDANAEAIKRAYRRLAKSCHPDAYRGSDETAAQERFNEITEAYEVLIDSERRKKYDQMNVISPGVSGTYQPGDGEARDNGSWDEKAEDDGDRWVERHRAGTPKVDRIVELDVSFEKAVQGGRQTMTVLFEETCEKCNGTGARSRRDKTNCPRCKGQGIIFKANAAEPDKELCPVCNGRGALIRRRCNRCQGTGKDRKDRKITVEIPVGVEDGSRFLLRELVDPAENPGIDGIQVNLRVTDHPFFKRDGMDIHCEVQISREEARRGVKKPIRTAWGRRVILKVPAGTENGTMFRIKDEGIEKGDLRGHQIVTLKVEG